MERKLSEAGSFSPKFLPLRASEISLWSCPVSDPAKGAHGVFMSPTWAVRSCDLASSFVGKSFWRDSTMLPSLHHQGFGWRRKNDPEHMQFALRGVKHTSSPPLVLALTPISLHLALLALARLRLGEVYYCYWTQVRLPATQKPILERQVLVGKEKLLIQEAGNLGRRWTRVQKPALKILLDHESF